jgi:hypothetical protein
MSKGVEEARREAELRVAEARREAERRLTEVRTAVETEVGILPKKKHILMLLAAGAGGLALALRRGRRGKKPRRALKGRK